MSETTVNPAKGRRTRPSQTTKLLGVVILVASACWLLVLAARPHREPTYQGKTARQWFEASFSSKLSFDPFLEMEGDAIPVLTSWVNARPSAADRVYAMLVANIPSGMAKRLPPPRDYRYYLARRLRAIDQLGRIGNRLLAKALAGDDLSAALITNAIPALQIAMLDTNDDVQGLAANAAFMIGPAAAVTIPELINLTGASGPLVSGTACQALGNMGPLASNAVPALVRIAKNNAHEARYEALIALASIGPAASEFVPELTSPLSDRDSRSRFAKLRLMIFTGITPPDAVPALTTLATETNNLTSTLAALALWNRDRPDTNLLARLKAELHTDRRTGLVLNLAALGTNAAPFASEIKLALKDGDTNFNHYAVNALRRIEPTAP